MHARVQARGTYGFRKNLDRRWNEWLENFELVLDFEGVTDPAEGKSKKKAALLTVGGQVLREI